MNGHARAATLAAALTACAGAFFAPSSQAPAAAPCTPVAQVKVQLFGDSTQEGYDGSNNRIAPDNPTAALQTALDARYGRGLTRVTSRAMEGTTAQELLAGKDRRNRPWPQSVDAHVIVINHGINDATHYGGARFPEYRATLLALATGTPTGTAVIFETPNIVKGRDLAPYAQTMREVAAEKGLTVADTYAYTASLPNWQTLIPDWAHPSNELYRIIVANSLAPAVISQADRLLCRR